jgi:flagellar hook-length control protein FliK
MTIEIAPQAPSAGASKSSETAANKKNAKDAAGGTGGTSSFLSVLACAEDTLAVPATDATLTAMPDGTADWLVVSRDGLPSNMASDASALGLPVTVLAPSVPAVTLVEAQPVAATGPGKSSAGLARDTALLAQAGLEPGLSKAGLAQTKSGKAVLDAAAEAAKPALLDSTGASGSQSGQSVAKESVPERIHKAVQELTLSMVKSPELSTLSFGINRERTQEFASSSRTTVNELAGQSLAVPQGAGGAMGVDGVVASSASAAADGQYSEEVSYWVGQDLQKAEMTVDGLGANPVEVSISMQGKEATVVFRSDEALTREALSNASVELQESLGRQGVMLSGVSVGTSNSGDSQRQGQNGKPPGWKVRSVEVVADPVATGVRGGGTTGRSIDLFV